MNDKSYSTYIVGADDFTVDPFLDKIVCTGGENSKTGYLITYSVPLPLLGKFIEDLPDDLLEKLTFKVKRRV
jgi:hypothetical protein